MMKKLVAVIALLMATMGMAFAQVDVNKADGAALDGVKGIGAKTAQQIVAERKKGGDFKDWRDLEKRVKGIGDKRAVRLSAAGLTVNGHAFTPAPANKPHAVAGKIAAKEMKK